MSLLGNKVPLANIGKTVKSGTTKQLFRLIMSISIGQFRPFYEDLETKKIINVARLIFAEELNIPHHQLLIIIKLGATTRFLDPLSCIHYLKVILAILARYGTNPHHQYNEL